MNRRFVIYVNSIGFVTSETYKYTPNFNHARQYVTYTEAVSVRQQLVDLGLKKKLNHLNIDHLIIVAVP